MTTPGVPPPRVRLALLCGSVIVGLLLVEGTLRARQWWRYGSAGTTLYATVIDPGSGIPIAAPGQATSRIRINSMGFRGPELSVAKPAGRIRLAFLGASTTFCAEVSSNDATWPDLVRRTLSEAFPRADFDYVNAAFPGYTLDTSRKNLQQRVARLAPDVILVYHAANDLSVAVRRLGEARGLHRGNIDDDHLLGRWSLTWSLLEKNVRLLARQRAAASAKGTGLTFEPAELSADFGIALRRLVRDAQRLSPLVGVITFSQKVRADQNAQEQLRNANTHLYYMPYLAVGDFPRAFAEYNRVIRETALATGALLIDRENAIPGDDHHFRDSVHFTDEGSRAMAARVSGALVASSTMSALVAAAGPRGGVPAQGR